MTVEAENAVAVSYQLEVKKDSLKQMQSGEVKISLTVHPQDMPPGFYLDPMGQRYMCVLVPLGDDEMPRMPEPKSVKKPREKRSWEEMPYAAQAGTLCSDKGFQSYIERTCSATWRNALTQADGDVAEAVAVIVRKKCGVSSRSDILPGTPAAEAFERIVSDFRDAQAAERFEEQYGQGPR